MSKKESFLCMSVRRVGAQVRKQYTHLKHFNRKSKFFSVILASKTVNAQTTHVASPYIVAYIQKWRVVELLGNGLFSIYQQNLQGLVKVSIVIASECLFEMYYVLSSEILIMIIIIVTYFFNIYSISCWF